MNERKQVVQQTNLLQARKNVREELEVGLLRPHGKLWTMDVFTWFKPSFQELENTLSSFPYPTIWFGTQQEIEEILVEDETWIQRISLVCMFENNSVGLSADIIHRIPSFLTCNQLEDGLELLKKLKISKSVLLFTSSSENWKEHKQIFERYLQIHQ
jgi:hypothetical protein